MPGAGRKVFVAGTVLTAADVNDYLMDQAVMRFSGSAARAASITAPTEGMITYLDDVNRVEYYDGAAWVAVTPTDVLRANRFTAKGQVLVASAAASPVAVTIGADGSVLTADSTTTSGVAWRAVTGGRAALFSISSASTNTALSASLPAGYYQMSTNSSLSYDTSEFRFVTADGTRFGVSLVAGAGTFTIPEGVASVNVTKGNPMTGLIQEVQGITSILQGGPPVTGMGWAGAFSASFNATASSGVTAMGIYNRTTGSLVSLPTSGGTGVVTVVPDGLTYGTPGVFKIVQQAANGTWSTATTASAPGTYPFYVYSANGTYVPPPGSSSAEIVVVAGGGGGGWKNPGTPATCRSGGGGAGGFLYANNVSASAPVAITIGSGGNPGVPPGNTTGRGSNGGNSSFGPGRVATGGGGGGMGTTSTAYGTTPGNPGGSGGGAGAIGSGAAATGGTGTPGQGFAGAGTTAPYSTQPAGGGGGASASGGAGTGGAGLATLVGYPIAIGGNTSTGATHASIIYGGGGRGDTVAGNPGIVIVRPL